MPGFTTSWRMLTPAFRNSKRRKGFFSAPSGWMPPPPGLISCWEKYWRRKARRSLPSALCSASLTHGGFGDPHVFVGAPVVEEKTIALLYHAFDKNYIRNLAGLLPFHFGREDRIAGARENLARVLAIEYGNAGAVNVPVVGTVVNQDDTTRREGRRGPGLDDAGVELTGPARQNRSVERL